MFMDNVSVHKVDGVEEAIEARGAIPFYLPAYSPDLNPIEQLFAKLKALLRKVMPSGMWLEFGVARSPVT